MADHSKQPVDELTQRLEYLEHIITPGDDEGNQKSLNQQIDELQGVVDSLFEKYEPVTQLNSLLYNLDLWDTLDEITAGGVEKNIKSPEPAQLGETSEKQTAIDHDSNVEHQKLIVLNQSKLFESVSSSAEKVTKIPANIMTTSPVKVASLKEDLSKYLDQINEVTETTEELSVRTAQAVKYYLENIVVKSNEMLVDCDEQLTIMEKKLKAISEEK